MHNSLMETKKTYPDLIRKLLQLKIVMSIKQIRHELAGRPRSSLFRDLKKIECLTSYSHAGQYHALKSKVKFNADGLWFYERVCFSHDGTLKNTLIRIISNSPAGMTHKELKTLLHIQVQNPLTHLVKINNLQRRVLAEQIFVYLSYDEPQALDQWQKRLDINEKSLSMMLPTETIVIDILLEIIRGNGALIDEEELGNRLKKRGVIVQPKQLNHVLTYYDLKKNGS